MNKFFVYFVFQFLLFEGILSALFVLQNSRVGNESNFVFKLTNPKRIEKARKLIGKDKIVIGKICKRKAPYNPKWSFHLVPESITFADQAIEVCDATPTNIEDQLAEVCGAFLPNCVWCPWSFKIVREIKEKDLILLKK